MTAIKKNIVFPEEIKQRLRSFITERSGIYFKDHDLKGLEDALIDRMESMGMDSAVTYYSYIVSPETREDEMRELLNRLTITHTYFFRNEPQFKALRERILPEIVERKLAKLPAANDEQKKPVLRVWSAGCSTGEEPYSIAMTALDVIPDPENWDIQIIATDASTEALDKARRGVYGKSSLKPVDKPHLDKYFTEEGGSAHNTLRSINPEIKKMVTFGFHNLITDDFPGGFDIIFFRNVAIYFELDTTIKVMEKIYSGLNNDGYLFIGYSESLYFMNDKFRMIDWEEAIYYRKIKLGAKKQEETARPSRPEKTIDQIIEELSRSERAAELEAESKRIKPPARNVEELLVRATKLYHTKDYSRALSLLQEIITADGDLVDGYYLQAQVYLNLGKFKEAKSALTTALYKNQIFAPAHYLLGCIAIEESMFERAKDSLKKAIYLDKDFPLAHFYLAHVYRNESRISDAIREYRNTLKLLSNVRSGDILAYGGGFDAATLIGACRDNIERLKMGATNT